MIAAISEALFIVVILVIWCGSFFSFLFFLVFDFPIFNIISIGPQFHFMSQNRSGSNYAALNFTWARTVHIRYGDFMCGVPCNLNVFFRCFFRNINIQTMNDLRPFTFNVFPYFSLAFVSIFFHMFFFFKWFGFIQTKCIDPGLISGSLVLHERSFLFLFLLLFLTTKNTFTRQLTTLLEDHKRFRFVFIALSTIACN